MHCLLATKCFGPVILRPRERAAIGCSVLQKHVVIRWSVLRFNCSGEDKCINFGSMRKLMLLRGVVKWYGEKFSA